MQSINTAQLLKLTSAQIVKHTLPLLVTAYGKPYCAIVPVDWVTPDGTLSYEDVAARAVDSDGLTIADKRRLLREFIASPGCSHQAKAKYLELDSRLAGHFAPDRTEIITTINEADMSRLFEVAREAVRLEYEAMGLLPTPPRMVEAKTIVGKEVIYDNDDV